MASERVRTEWRNRIAAEYGSAAITQHLGLWLIQLGAPPDLIDASLAIVADELAHARLSHDVLAAAGGTGAPALDRDALALPRTAGVPLEYDVLAATVRVFCLGETVAVPLFAHLRAAATAPAARAALDRIVRDEVRHRDFGWDLYDFLATIVDARALVVPLLPAMLADVHASYGAATDDRIGGEDRAWGLAPPSEYAAVLATAIERDYRPRFAARGIALP